MPKKKAAPHLRCPTCNQIVLRDAEHYPFCSDRCRLTDLGKWASGGYRISSPILDPEVLENLSNDRPAGVDDEDSGRKN